MNTTAQNIAIAEASGWVWYRVPTHPRQDVYRTLCLPAIHEYEGQSKEWLVRADGSEKVPRFEWMQEQSHLWDYTKDEKGLRDARSEIIGNNPEKRAKFLSCLREIISRRMPKNSAGHALISDYDLLDSKTEEQAEAIVRMLGRWVE